MKYAVGDLLNYIPRERGTFGLAWLAGIGRESCIVEVEATGATGQYKDWERNEQESDEEGALCRFYFVKTIEHAPGLQLIVAEFDLYTLTPDQLTEWRLSKELGG